MNIHEETISIAGAPSDMLGIISKPGPGAHQSHIAVVVVVGGDQYRVGSHRQFVRMARHLASAGHPVLRFDFPGMGDSPGETVAFEAASPHIAAAVNAVRSHCPDVTQVVLWGLCDGASAILLYAHNSQDRRISGLVLLNPWVRSETSLARAQVKHYYLWRLAERAFWHKLISGKVGWQALKDLGNNVLALRRPKPGPASFQEAMADGWRAFSGHTLLLLSERDLVAKEFMEHAQTDARWAGLLERPNVSHSLVEGADHTFSSSTASRQTESFVLQWLSRMK